MVPHIISYHPSFDKFFAVEYRSSRAAGSPATIVFYGVSPGKWFSSALVMHSYRQIV